MENPWYQSGGGDTELHQLYKVGTSGGGRNPAQDSQYKRLLTQYGLPENATPGITSGSTAGLNATSAIDEAKKIRQFNIESNQPYIQTLEASKSPLQSRYQDLVTELTRKEGVETQQTNTALSREYGKRGIPLSSGAFTQDLAEKQRPTSEFYAGQRSQAATASEQGISEINTLIGQLQSGDPASSISAALQLQQLSQSGRQFDIQNALAQRQQQFAETQGNRQYELASKEDPFARFTSVGEGQTIYDLLGGNALYTNPKTYKGTTGEGSDPY